ncbi:hypothetical protein Q4I32_001691 [Leishmania shawi]|uniref:Uncharacterized protein n=1 Tax=Leishmania shawi TaxID=5680 RepID=A0AAW3C9V1_9TRYP
MHQPIPLYKPSVVCACGGRLKAVQVCMKAVSTMAIPPSLRTTERHRPFPLHFVHPFSCLSDNLFPLPAHTVPHHLHIPLAFLVSPPPQKSAHLKRPTGTRSVGGGGFLSTHCAMPAKSQFLKGLEDKPHHVTIPLEDWHDLTFRKCLSFTRLYGVSGMRIYAQTKSGNMENRTFRIIHVVPRFMSEAELLDREKLPLIAKERNLEYARVCDALYRLQRRHAQTHSKAVSPVPPAQTLDIGGALAEVLALRTTPCFGLHLLVTVQSENTEQQSASPALTDVAARAHLKRLPLPVLHRFISELAAVRAAWERDLLAPSAAAAIQEQALLGREVINALLYHICLWQRRYPLELLSAVLSFYDDQRQPFSPATPASRLTPAHLESLLEEAHRLYYPDLSDVPGLIRCDVFMTYPHMPLEEQRQLMRKIAAAVAHREAAGSLRHQSTSMGAEEDCATDNLFGHSRTPPDPQLLLRSFVVDGATVIPERFCTDMSTEKYHTMRDAFELHKHDGVRRLAAQDYGRTSTNLTSLPPPQPAASSMGCRHS